MTNKTNREQAINRIFNSWIETVDPERMGQIIRKGSFEDLKNEVTELHSMGRTDRWHKAIEDWEAHVDKMFLIFIDQNFPDLKGSDAMLKMAYASTDTDYTTFTRSEFQRLLKHAVMQGSIFAHYGNC